MRVPNFFEECLSQEVSAEGWNLSHSLNDKAGQVGPLNCTCTLLTAYSLLLTPYSLLARPHDKHAACPRFGPPHRKRGRPFLMSRSRECRPAARCRAYGSRLRARSRWPLQCPPLRLPTQPYNVAASRPRRSLPKDSPPRGPRCPAPSRAPARKDPLRHRWLPRPASRAIPRSPPHQRRDDPVELQDNRPRSASLSVAKAAKSLARSLYQLMSPCGAESSKLRTPRGRRARSR